VIEVAIDGAAPVLMPFTREVVPEVDIAGGRLVVVPPPGLMDEGAEGARRQEDG
jgi:16S rRNA processing protein RimM